MPFPITITDFIDDEAEVDGSDEGEDPEDEEELSTFT